MRKLISIMFACCLLGLSTVLLAAPSVNEVVGVKILPLPDNKVRLIFQFQKPLKSKPTSFVMKNPAKIVFDFLSVKEGLTNDQLNKEINIGVLKRYAIIPGSNRLRAILDLSTVVGYNTSISGKQFNVTLAGKLKRHLYRAKETFYANRYVRTKHTVTDVDFRGGGKHSGKLVIRISDPNMGVDVAQRGRKIYVKFLDTRIPRKLIRRLDVQDFHTPAKMVDSFQRGRNAQFVINTKGDYGHFAYQINKEFIVEVFPLTPEEIKQAKLKKEVYTGRRISLNFQDISVRAVLQLIAEFTGVNLVVSDGVQGNITLRLNDIPWDQALSIIMKTRGLVKRKMGEVILIAPSLEVTAREKQELDLLQQSKALAPLLSELMQINYAKASDIAALLINKDNRMLSKRGVLNVDVRTNTIWIQDTAAKLSEIKDLVHKLDIPVRQVLIEARVVIVNKDFEKDLGIRFGVTRPNYMSGRLAGANLIRGGTAPTGVPVESRLNLDLGAPVTTGTAGTIGIALARLGEGVLLDLELSALETEGKGEIISSPRLITANQQAAFIEAGEEIPYLEATSSGASSISFKKAVLSLKVTPQITPDDKIILDLAVNQDQASTQRFNGVPAILTKEIDTNVLVNNGQTIVLGGIYKQDKKSAVRRIPYLGEMPFIGALFRNKQEIVKHEELLIFITPKIIRPSFVTN